MNAEDFASFVFLLTSRRAWRKSKTGSALGVWKGTANGTAAAFPGVQTQLLQPEQRIRRTEPSRVCFHSRGVWLGAERIWYRNPDLESKKRVRPLRRLGGGRMAGFAGRSDLETLAGTGESTRQLKCVLNQPINTLTEGLECMVLDPKRWS